jgi:hypothetical protein
MRYEWNEAAEIFVPGEHAEASRCAGAGNGSRKASPRRRQTGPAGFGSKRRLTELLEANTLVCALRATIVLCSTNADSRFLPLQATTEHLHGDRETMSD